MACDTGVVASRVGGIPEIVVDGETGYMVDYDARHPEKFVSALARRIEAVLSNPDLAARMGKAGRERAVTNFGWPAIARQTVELYDSLLSAGRERSSGS